MIGHSCWVWPSCFASRPPGAALGILILAPRRASNERWSLDFVADQFPDSRSLRRILSSWSTIAPDLGVRVARTLDRLLGERGKLKTVVSDNGTQLTSNAILRWADDQVSTLCISHSSKFGS